MLMYMLHIAYMLNAAYCMLHVYCTLQVACCMYAAMLHMCLVTVACALHGCCKCATYRLDVAYMLYGALAPSKTHTMGMAVRHRRTARHHRAQQLSSVHLSQIGESSVQRPIDETTQRRRLSKTFIRLTTPQCQQTSSAVAYSKTSP